MCTVGVEVKRVFPLKIRLGDHENAQQMEILVNTIKREVLK